MLHTLSAAWQHTDHACFLQTLAAAQALDGPLMASYRGLARELRLWISLGGFQERGPDPEHTHNTHVILDSSGATAAAYRKAPLPAYSAFAVSAAYVMQ